jgi:hypothetical protein
MIKVKFLPLQTVKASYEGRICVTPHILNQGAKQR